MNKNVLTIEIEKLISEVFLFTTRPENTPSWITFVKEEKVDSDPIKVGTKYSNTCDGNIRTEYLCTRYEENKIFELKNTSSPYVVEYMYEELSPEKTKLIYTEYMSDGSDLPEIFGVENLERLKNIVENK